MKQKFRKGLAISTIFLLMLVSIPMVCGEDILYPKEEGPYNVLIFGKSTGMGGGLFDMFIHFWPLWFKFYPSSINWDFEEGSVFYVNGEKQDIVYPAQIWISGFKGYGQSFHMLLLKDKVAILMGFFTSSMPTTRARIIGRCDEIELKDSR